MFLCNRQIRSESLDMINSKIQTEEKKGHVTRREFIGIVWIGILSTGALKLVETLGKVLIPHRPQGEYGGEFEIGLLTTLPKPGEAPRSYPEGRFWLVNTETGLLALHRACTHLDCLISWDESMQKFLCPCHGSEFSRNGTCLQGPASRSLDRFSLQVVTVDGKVIIETDPAGAPLPVEQLQTGVDSAMLAESVIIVKTANKIKGYPIG